MGFDFGPIRPSVVELHPQAAERYAAKVADIHAALARGDAGGHEAIALIRELITRVRVIPTARGQPVGLEIAGYSKGKRELDAAANKHRWPVAASLRR